VIILVVATITVHWPNGFSSIKLLAVDAAGAHFGQPGYETDLLYLAALVALVIGGSGPLALDRAWLGGMIGDSPDREAPRKPGGRPFPTTSPDGER
jgi:putative oxidoreductase